MAPKPEIRIQTPEGTIEVIQPEQNGPEAAAEAPENLHPPTVAQETAVPPPQKMRLYPYGVDRRRLERGLQELGVEATLTRDFREADAILYLKAHSRHQGGRMRELLTANVPCYVVKSNTYAQILSTLRDVFPARQQRPSEELKAVQEAEEGVYRVLAGDESAELYPQRRHIRRL